jgi:hypothetical protein
LGWISGPEVQHATSRIAVEGGIWSSQNFYATEAGEIEMIECRLAVWQCRRDSIDQHPDSADPKLGAWTEPANGNPLSHSKVKSVVDLQTWHSPNGLLDEGRTCCTGQL